MIDYDELNTKLHAKLLEQSQNLTGSNIIPNPDGSIRVIITVQNNPLIHEGRYTGQTPIDDVIEDLVNQAKVYKFK